MRAAVAGAIAATAVLVASGLLWLFLDPDGDGLSSIDEFRGGTDPTRADTDHDGLMDGWEVARGLDPQDPDMDRDGLLDGEDIRQGGDARNADTDGDGIPDLDESGSRNVDCNRNGILAIADSDDDSDQRPDGAEPLSQRCNPDVDADGVLDGGERAAVCVTNPDCDGDGLGDAAEPPLGFDPLNPDTLGARLPDSILYAFREHGQNASGDLDDDGIPDAWETSNGLIDWGGFHPAPGRRDLLIEALRVEGPDSSRYDALDLSSPLRTIADTFATQGGTTLQWIETRVVLPVEARPPNLPSSLAPYYADLLNHSRYAANPYVSTLVLNPQHDQTDVVHLGIAPIRGMLAAVDYGAHTELTFKGVRVDTVGQRTTRTNLTLTVSPLAESLIAANRQDAIQAMGFTSGNVLGDGRYQLVASSYRLEWTPLWFRTAPRVVYNDGTVVQLSFSSSRLDTSEFANTVFHELGHTLGLCHLELADCLRLLPAAEQTQRTTSSMYTAHDPATIRFLPGEWTRVHQFLACPPLEPVRLVADNATDPDIIHAKYAYTLDDVLNVNVRSCGDFSPVRPEFSPEIEPRHYEAPPQDRDPPVPDPSRFPFYMYLASDAFLVAAAALLPGALRRP